MTEKDTKNADPNDPRNQVAKQTTREGAAPGEPGHYSPPDPNVGVTKSPPNEVIPPEAKQQPAGGTETEENYEEMTVPELKELAHQRGVEIHSDMLKDDIIQALKKA
jgi:hypothetical protein